MLPCSLHYACHQLQPMDWGAWKLAPALMVESATMSMELANADRVSKETTAVIYVHQTDLAQIVRKFALVTVVEYVTL